MTFLKTLLLLVQLLAFLQESRVMARAYDECETLPSTIHVTQEERNDAGRMVRQCEADVSVSKCEGSCPSKVQPSVNTLSGFYKDCRCCRESQLRQREVVLSHCYDADGIRLTGAMAAMTISIREPSDCACFKCGDPTR